MTAAGMISLILAAAGLMVMIASLIGLIRFPDFFTRLHIQGVGDTLGALLIILGMMAATGAHLITVKIFLIFLVIMLTNPIGTNLMMIAAIFNKDYQAYTWTRPGSKPEIGDVSKTPAADIEKPGVSGNEKSDTDKSDTGKKEISAPEAVNKADSKTKRRSGRSKPSMKKTRPELIEIAEGMGINVPENATKKVILELIYQEKPELRPEASASKQSGDKKSGSKKAGTKQSGQKRSGTKQSGSKKAGTSKSASKQSSAKRSDGANNSKAGASKPAAKTGGREKTGKNSKRSEGRKR